MNWSSRTESLAFWLGIVVPQQLCPCGKNKELRHLNPGEVSLMKLTPLPRARTTRTGWSSIRLRCIRSRGVRVHIDPSALPSLSCAFAIRRFIATAEDSNCSRRLPGLGGVAALYRKLGRFGPTLGALPAYLSASSFRVVLADLAGINSAWPTI